MTPDEHRAAAERLLELADDYAADADEQWEAVTALSRMADVHARLAQTPQPVTVATDPDAGLADMLTAARVAGSGDGQAILAGRAMAGERCACGHLKTVHVDLDDDRFGICLADRCTCIEYHSAGSEPGGEE